MYHDQHLVDLLSALPLEPFSGDVFRVTRGSLDPLAPSSSGGRWAPPAEPEAGFLVLYTSLERDGALAEVVSYLVQQTPVPREQSLVATQLAVSAKKVVTLDSGDFTRLEIDPSRYGERDYVRTQQIGAALVFLGADGLIAPSARWPCKNLMIFSNNHGLSERLEATEQCAVPWRAWAEKNGLLG